MEPDAEAVESAVFHQLQNLVTHRGPGDAEFADETDRVFAEAGGPSNGEAGLPVVEDRKLYLPSGFADRPGERPAPKNLGEGPFEPRRYPRRSIERYGQAVDGAPVTADPDIKAGRGVDPVQGAAAHRVASARLVAGSATRAKCGGRSGGGIGRCPGGAASMR